MMMFLPVTFVAWPMIVIPGSGAVWPATVRLLVLIASQPCRPAGASLMVPATSKTIVRPPAGAVLMP